MIDLYTWNTPNGRKVSILLEELGIDYTVHPVDITHGEQKKAAFVAISPNGRIPAIVDRSAGLTLMESGAIMVYLADQQERFLAPRGEQRWRTLEWLMWQMGGLGPMAGQAHHFLHFHPGRSDYASRRYGFETHRLYGVLEGRLAQREYLAGDYSIADMACWPWVSRFGWQQIDLDEFPAVARWYRDIAARPAVQRGYRVPRGGEVPMPGA